MFLAYRSRIAATEQPTSASESSEATAIIAPEEPINVSETINSRSPSPQKSLVQRIQLLDNRHNQNLSAFADACGKGDPTESEREALALKIQTFKNENPDSILHCHRGA